MDGVQQMVAGTPQLVGNIEGPRRPLLWIVGQDLTYYRPFARIFSLADSIEEAEVALFTGGEDVTPELYGEKNIGLSYNNEERDRQEVKAFEELRSRHIPLIGICRGAQFLTAMSGGKLYQDVKGHGLGVPGHMITTDGGETLEMSSTHHQMMRPRGEFKLIAWTNHLSSHYLPEREPELKVDPEIVFYPKTMALCIQGHPEYFSPDSVNNQYCRRLVQQYLFGRQH
jgi:GMP synthase-like glutamine amidotransferase